MLRNFALGFVFLACASGTAASEEFNADAVHAKLTDAFNTRQWETFKGLLADDIVFHRANAPEVYVGLDAVIEIFKGTIGAPDQWNVKLAILESSHEFVGKDGRVVERGDFAITAGADDGSCYRGSYMMTWVPQADSDWRLQMLAWQDVETDIANCK